MRKIYHDDKVVVREEPITLFILLVPLEEEREVIVISLDEENEGLGSQLERNFAHWVADGNLWMVGPLVQRLDCLELGRVLDLPLTIVFLLILPSIRLVIQFFLHLSYWCEKCEHKAKLISIR